MKAVHYLFILLCQLDEMKKKKNHNILGDKKVLITFYRRLTANFIYVFTFSDELIKIYLQIKIVLK